MFIREYVQEIHGIPQKKKLFSRGYLVRREQISMSHIFLVATTLYSFLTRFFKKRELWNVPIDKNSQCFRLNKVRIKYVGTIAFFDSFFKMPILFLDSLKNNYDYSKPSVHFFFN